MNIFLDLKLLAYLKILNIDLKFMSEEIENPLTMWPGSRYHSKN